MGVKAVEYSHKWDMGIFPRSSFDFTYMHPEQTIIGGLSDYLVYLSVIPLLLLIGFAVTSVIFRLTDKAMWSKFWVGMTLTVAGYFIGVVIGVLFMAAGIGEAKHASLEPVGPIALHAMTQEHGHAEAEHGHATDHAHAGHGESGHDESGHGDHHGDDHAHAHAEGGHDHHGDDHGHGAHAEIPEFDRNVGTFFSIYYCMWLYWRSINNHWRSDYFGPVDYVGLYWHLVDLIWIYLFPLLYLID